MRAHLAVAATVLALAALSLTLPSAPGYDPWAWLVWGREIARGGLDTVDGPAFKPLPVAVDAVLWRLLGDGLAPDAWIVLARAAALGAVALTARLAFVLAGGTAAVLAGIGAFATMGLLENAAAANAEGAAALLLLGAVGAGLAGRPRAALGLGVGLALLRPESWPGLLLYGAWVARTDVALRPWLGAGVVGVLALWFVPEQLGSGSLERSGARARVPNPGQPATAAVPGLAALREGLGLPLLPLLLAVAFARGRALVPALVGLAWIGVVAAMAQLLGTSGEGRYSLPGAVLVVVSGTAGLVALGGRARSGAARGRGGWLLPGAAVVGLLVAVAVRAGDVPGELRRAADGAELSAALPVAIAAAGGRERVLACGAPVVGRYRGPMVAWALGLPRRRVQTPGGTGTLLLRSRIRRGAALLPPAPPGVRVLARSTRWVIACAPFRPPESESFRVP